MSPLRPRAAPPRARRRLARWRRAHELAEGDGYGDLLHTVPGGEDELLALNTALEELARMNPRQAMMVESRFFGGLDIPETAALLNVSEATVLRDWRAAKAWLTHELRRA